MTSGSRPGLGGEASDGVRWEWGWDVKRKAPGMRMRESGGTQVVFKIKRSTRCGRWSVGRLWCVEQTRVQTSCPVWCGVVCGPGARCECPWRVLPGATCEPEAACVSGLPLSGCHSRQASPCWGAMCCSILPHDKGRMGWNRVLPGVAASGMQGKVSSEGQGCCQFASNWRPAQTPAR